MDHVFIWSGIVLTSFALGVMARDDWLHALLARCRVTGEVSGYRSQRDEGSISYAAIYRFTTADGRRIEVLDSVLQPTQTPPLGATVALVHPLGHPEKARRPRPVLRLVIYIVIGAVLALLVLRLTGRIAA